MAVLSSDSARIQELLIAPPNVPFTDPEAISLGYAELRTQVIEALSNADYEGAEDSYAYNVNIEHNGFQAQWTDLLNRYLFIKQNPNLQARATMAGQEQSKYCYVASTTLLGMGFAYEHTKDKAVLKTMLSGQMSPTRYKALLDGAAAGIAGGTGGASLGLDLTGFDVAQKVVPNVNTISLDILSGPSAGSRLIGAIVDFNFKLDSFAEREKDDNNHYIHNKFNGSLESTILNARVSEQLLFLAGSTQLIDITVTLPDGRQIIKRNARTKFAPTLSDNDRAIKFSTKWSNPYNGSTLEATPDSIDFGVTDPNILEFKSKGLT